MNVPMGYEIRIEHDVITIGPEPQRVSAAEQEIGPGVYVDTGRVRGTIRPTFLRSTPAGATPNEVELTVTGTAAFVQKTLLMMIQLIHMDQTWEKQKDPRLPV